jgi:hypothetical protein
VKSVRVDKATAMTQIYVLSNRVIGLDGISKEIN